MFGTMRKEGAFGLISLLAFPPSRPLSFGQECIILDDLRQALHEHLGGPSEYTMFQADVGAATMLYGTIALTAFARAR